MQNQATTPSDRGRRGMLLLLVLNVLALFLVVGALGILVATRARDSARAFAAAQAGQVNSPALARGLLDEALLTLVRGGTAATGVTECLLEDKYGTSQSGTVTALAPIPASGNSLMFGTMSVTSTVAIVSTATNVRMVGSINPVSGSCAVLGAPPWNSLAFTGRPLTIVPAVNDQAFPPTTYRFTRFWPLTTATTGSTTISGTTFWTVVTTGSFHASAPRLQMSGTRPSVFPCEAVINGRDFDGTGTNEPYDAFDASNPFLTNSGTLNGSRVQQVARAAFPAAATSGTCVDNDGDGVADGVWLDGVLPPMRSPNGGQLTFSVSYLVLDLDGRINVNAHGSVVRAQAVSSAATYPARPTPFLTGGSWTLTTAGTIPQGMGYGPADIDASIVVYSTDECSSGDVPARYATLLQGGTVDPPIALTSSPSQWRPAPRAGATQVGRHGASVGPGNAAVTTGGNWSNADYWMLNPAGNSPTDLKARLQVFTDGTGAPILKFARPTSYPTWVANDTDDIVGAGQTAHPYALRLDDDAPRAAGSNSLDAIYTVAELERILRPFDSDAAQLAPRLAAILDDRAEQSRMTVTTDSWDTPAVTGATSGTIQMAAADCPVPHDVLAPETVAGLRMNLNRPIFPPAATGTAARAEYFKHLYTLAMAVSGTTGDSTAAIAAQWAANVIEFRDPDSIMTWYPYDPTPFDADGFTTSGTSPGVWGVERPEVVITSATYSPDANTVTVSLYRPWEARLISGTNISGSTAPMTELIDASLGNRATNTLNLSGTAPGNKAIWRLAIVNSSTTDWSMLTPLASGAAVRCNSGTTVTGTGLASMPPSVTLLRLADPSRVTGTANDLTRNDYVPVHTGTVTVAAAGARVVRRWLHWPNRDFVSHGELLTVPSGTAAAVAEALFDENNEACLALNGAPGATGSSAPWGPRLLDATIVPSRFAGANVSVNNGATALAGTGLENLRYGQLSRWREAGRVNLNTILSNTNNATSALDNAVWTALVGGTSVPNPVTSGGYTPIQSLQTVLTGPTADLFIRSGTNAASSFLKRSTAIRLANCATTRSHVFAVWITLRITDSSPTAGPPQFARLFAIVDRSIPVGYAPGRTLNVRDTIRLQRFVE